MKLSELMDLLEQIGEAAGEDLNVVVECNPNTLVIQGVSWGSDEIIIEVT